MTTTSEVPITVSQIIAKIRELSEARPDFVYSKQSGHVPDDPGSYLGARIGEEGGEACIVGQALSSLGVSDSFLRSQENTSADSVIMSLLRWEDADLTRGQSDALYWTDRVQARQDSGLSWGEAVSSADQEYARRKSLDLDMLADF